MDLCLGTMKGEPYLVSFPAPYPSPEHMMETHGEEL